MNDNALSYPTLTTPGGRGLQGVQLSLPIGGLVVGLGYGLEGLYLEEQIEQGLQVAEQGLGHGGLLGGFGHARGDMAQEMSHICNSLWLKDVPCLCRDRLIGMPTMPDSMTS